MIAPAPDPSAAPWRALPLSGPPLNAAQLSPRAVDRSWQALLQSWRTDGPEPGFNPGWAHLSWEPSGLWLEAVLLGAKPANRARRLNECTWELGDVCEFFLQVSGAPEYLELHVTPENQRLQLAWPDDGLQRVRAGTVPLDDFLIARSDWVQSSAFIGPGFWAAQVFIPAGCLGAGPLAPGQSFSAAVCRYDCSVSPGPVLSSTALLHEPSYHRRHEWHQVVLAPLQSGKGASR